MTKAIQVQSMAINPIFNDKQIVMLVQKTPTQHIHARKGRGGQTFKYATTSYVQKVLNEAFGWAWSFQVVSKELIGNQVVVQGRLTVINKETLQPMIIKEQFGGAEVKYLKGTDIPVDLADDFKAAASDALKKAASLLGVSADLYADPQTASEITSRAEKVKAVILAKHQKEQDDNNQSE